MTSKEIYIENPKAKFPTVNNMLRKLEKEAPTSDNAQVVLQFGKDYDGMAWKMFIYYGFTEENDYEEPVYFFSYQDEDMEDTLTEWVKTRREILARAMFRANTFGLDWIACDYEDYNE